jgi:DNA-binding XRE family transcriptional regulator
MMQGMGQFVPSVKAIVSRDFTRADCYYPGVIEYVEEAEFNQKLCARIFRLRSERGWTQAQMAAAIGVPHERYKKYETRSPMPAYLVPRFALQVDRDPCYVLTGKQPEHGRRAPRVLVRTANGDQTA